MRKSYRLSPAPLLAFVLAATASASAATPRPHAVATAATSTVRALQDDAWLAFIGCWKADGDTSDNMLCIVPDGDGVRMITMAGRTVQSETRVVADNRPRNISEEGCSGTERTRWSADLQRVFINADMTCGKNLTRKVTGVFAVLATHWVNVQSVTSGGTTDTRTIRYVEVKPADLPENIAQAFRNNRLARETAHDAAASPLDLDDVREAVANVAADVVEGWLTAVNQGFDVNGKQLIKLADDGVPSSVIDVIVALSNPRHFAVRETLARDTERQRERRLGGYGGDPCWGDSYGSLYDPFSYRHSRYGYGNGYGCGTGGGFYPWGYGGYGGYGYGGGTVIVVERPGSSEPSGKVTKQGYKSGRARDDSAASDKTPTGTAVSRPSSGSSDGSSSKPASGGSSSGGSSSGTTRKAHPRDN